MTLAEVDVRESMGKDYNGSYEPVLTVYARGRRTEL